jgi:Fe-S cluster assembly protein SufD
MISTATKTKVDRAAYLAKLLNLRSSWNAPAAIAAIQKQAAVRVQELAIPSIRDEEWRFTDLSALVAIAFIANTSDPESVDLAEIESLLVPEALNRAVFINGSYAPWLSSIQDSLAGLFVGSLGEAFRTDTLPVAVQQQLTQVASSEDAFTLLNTASFTDTAVIWVGKNQQIKAPIHLLFLSLSGAEPLVNHPRCFVLAESGSNLTLIEEYVTLGCQADFSNAVTEIWVQDNAEVNHTRVQHQSETTFHIGKTTVSQARDSRYTCNAITWGAKLSRHNLEIVSQGEQTETHLNGLTRIAGDQLADTHSTIAHTQPHGMSRQVHKCIVSDRAHAVFNGKILVPKAAQLTDAAQLSRNLLLSPKARVDTKPQLEIVADNVKCAHGATVSQLEADEIFYLQSRGINREMACDLLVYAFATDVLNRILIASVRDRLTQRLAHTF